MGIIHEDMNDRSLTLQGDPGILFQVVVTEVLEEIGVYDGPLVVPDVWTTVKCPQRRAQYRLGNMVFVEQKSLRLCSSRVNFLYGSVNICARNQSMIRKVSEKHPSALSLDPWSTG